MVYPRVGGGNSKPTMVVNPCWGLSPRGRGKPKCSIGNHLIEGSIPAWAGETKTNSTPVPPAEVYPRVGGGNRLSKPFQLIGKGLSPRGRGKPRTVIHTSGRGRSIPAWAGETQPGSAPRTPNMVYPRVGGGNA